MGTILFSYSSCSLRAATMLSPTTAAKSTTLFKMCAWTYSETNFSSADFLTFFFPPLLLFFAPVAPFFPSPFLFLARERPERAERAKSTFCRGAACPPCRRGELAAASLTDSGMGIMSSSSMALSFSHARRRRGEAVETAIGG